VRPRHLALLAVGVVAVSSSAILIRLAQAPPLAVSFYRCAMAAAVLLPLSLARRGREIRAFTPRQWSVACAAGTALALHFALWVPSLSYTSVAASTVLVTSTPVWVALLGRVTIGERVTRLAAAGIGLSIAGAALISAGDLVVSARALFGDALALAGAVAAAAYVLAGRDLRRSVSLVAYVGVVYAVAATLLAAAMVASGTPFVGYDPRVWGLFVLMTLGPQLLGHTLFNYLLAPLEASVVAVAITAEPVGASLLALLIFGEVPTPTAIAGGALILAGVYVAISGQGRRAAVEAPVRERAP
jgi:drug/metabolite transporter (DMT)-like permease